MRHDRAAAALAFVHPQEGFPKIDPKHRPEFRTKLELAVELLQLSSHRLSPLKKPIWVVADGAYAKADFLKPASSLGITIVSRLRKDATLCTVPDPHPKGRHGRPRVYGERRIDLAKRAGQLRGGGRASSNCTAGRRLIL